MMNNAFLFPGQGCQVIGMGKEFYDNFSVSKEVFLEVDDTLNYSLSKMIFEGPKEDLDNTQNAQVAIMTVSMAIYAALRQEAGDDIATKCQYMAGHSLGEYSAHTAAGSISLKDCAISLKLRGEAMNKACKPGEGAMAACLGISTVELEKVINDTTLEHEICQIANDNSLGQIVISGQNDVIDKMIVKLKQNKIKAIKLNVSSAFHSPLMANAELDMEPVLNKLKIIQPSAHIVTNVSATSSKDIEFLRSELIKQICGRVRWRETIDYLIEQNVNQFVEIGAGNVLSNLLKRSPYAENIEIVNISNIAQLSSCLKIIT